MTGPVHQRGSALLHHQRGAALLIALLILALVATAASSMVWHQQRAIEVETAERAQAQAVQLLDGGVDFARLLVRMAGAKVFQTNDNVVKLPDGRRAFQVAEMSVADMLQFDKDSSSGSTRNAFVDASRHSALVSANDAPEAVSTTRRAASESGRRPILSTLPRARAPSPAPSDPRSLRTEELGAV